MITKYNTLSNEELLRSLDGKRSSSSVIDELCNRLEAKERVSAGANHTVECPICEATLGVTT